MMTDIILELNFPGMNVRIAMNQHQIMESFANIVTVKIFQLKPGMTVK